MRIQPLNFNSISKLKTPVNSRRIQANNQAQDVFFKSSAIEVNQKKKKVEILTKEVLKEAQIAHKQAQIKYTAAQNLYANWEFAGKPNEQVLLTDTIWHSYPTGSKDITIFELIEPNGARKVIRYSYGKPIEYTEYKKGVEDKYIFSEKADDPSQAPVICKKNSKTKLEKNFKTSSTGQIFHFSSQTQKLISYRENEKMFAKYDENYNLDRMIASTKLAMYFNFSDSDEEFEVEIIKQNKNKKGQILTTRETGYKFNSDLSMAQWS